MAESVEGIRGEYRRLSSAEIGLMIRMSREFRDIKRAVLAAEAHLSEKTIERAEAGDGISAESASRIAIALGMQEKAFTEEIYIPTLEEAARTQQQKEENLRRTHRPVKVAAVEGVKDILSLFGCYAHFGDDQNVNEAHLGDYAVLKQTVVDYFDIAGDLSEPQRVEGAIDILGQVRQFERLGYVVKVGVARDYLWRGKPWPCSVLTAFKKPRGMIQTPDDIWLPKEAHMGF
jgi:transcriptional regulator with XRE-family HTH domain